MKRIDRFLQQRFPQIYFSLIQKPRNIFRFREERQHSRGKSLSNSKYRSILFFTTQKCASRYVGNVIGQLANAEGMPNIDYDAYVTMTEVPKRLRPFAQEGTLDIAFQAHGHFYGPIGSLRTIPNMDAYAIVLQLRDPRDVLTSLYFSTAYSHALINQKVVERRKAAQQISVDEFVLGNANQYEKIYAQYCQKLLFKPNVLFLKYEEMVSDFEVWLEKLAQHIGLNHLIDEKQRLIHAANFEVESENIYSQRRQVTPGDFRRKLTNRTIKVINTQFSSILKTLDYQ